MLVRRCCIIVLLVLSVPETGFAQAADSFERETYRQGRRHYTEGRYQKAIHAFERAYRSLRHPVLLFNIAASHLKLQQHAKALKTARRAERRFRTEQGELRERVTPGLVTRNGSLIEGLVRRKRARDVMAHIRSERREREADQTTRQASPNEAKFQAEPPSRGDMTRLTSLGWAGVVSGGVGLGLLAGSFGLHLDLRDELARAQSAPPGAEVHSTVVSKQRIGRGLLYAGTALALTGTTFVLVDLARSDERSPQSMLSWRPLIVSDGAGVVLQFHP